MQSIPSNHHFFAIPPFLAQNWGCLATHFEASCTQTTMWPLIGKLVMEGGRTRQTSKALSLMPIFIAAVSSQREGVIFHVVRRRHHRDEDCRASDNIRNNSSARQYSCSLLLLILLQTSLNPHPQKSRAEKFHYLSIPWSDDKWMNLQCKK